MEDTPSMKMTTEALKKSAVSIIVPCYKEAKNIEELSARIEKISHSFAKMELILVDDNSQDGSLELVEKLKLKLPWLSLVVRTSDRGLSSAVLEGFRRASCENLVVMDADLSHPPEMIPEMVQALLEPEYQMSLGSRYVPGGAIEEGWSVLRWLNSWGATLMARPLVKVRDPMSGFFAVTRSQLDHASGYEAIGYKIFLEVAVRSKCKNVKEIPIFFSERKNGESKLSFKVQMEYLAQLIRLSKFEKNLKETGSLKKILLSGLILVCSLGLQLVGYGKLIRRPLQLQSVDRSTTFADDSSQVLSQSIG